MEKLRTKRAIEKVDYTFVPVPPRATSAKSSGVAGDRRPNPHGFIDNNSISGWVDIKIEAKTRLLLSDIRYGEKENIRTVRTTGDGKTPYLLASSFKGAIRSAYETITNSRLSNLGLNVVDSEDAEKVTIDHEELFSSGGLGAHLPASSIDELSAADRVFGWVHKDAGKAEGATAYRGQLAFSVPQVNLKHRAKGDKDPIAVHNPPISLPALGNAHTEIEEFYMRERANGVQCPNGRKFYIPWRDHRNEEGPNNDEYLKIDSYVRPGTMFTVRVYMENVDRGDAAALLWLLDLSRHRTTHGHSNKPTPLLGLGYAKPLSYGFVEVSIDGSCVLDKRQMMERYTRLASTVPSQDLTQELITEFQNLSDPAIQRVREDFLNICTSDKKKLNQEERKVEFDRDAKH
ncbi:RAMP superfamily CRISPR-associated protein [Corynebacterium sp. ES2794-CONJ1]|uniref:RAMP superfamily CRISPR-associated protein n=1 Tax=Corynebacterium sp. ES2794-CONJ1 TaxID=2980553 RepID=UPI0021D86690|nr:RAMP superfamily CRISPR-associated protein [Corynebacterium sp. ES2794-CONJ1]MCU9518924.1 RAMP superfamily CRISPR-associated protein [Corynebacterium sp. ES2794-CONJ1]